MRNIGSRRTMRLYGARLLAVALASTLTVAGVNAQEPSQPKPSYDTYKPYKPPEYPQYKPEQYQQYPAPDYSKQQYPKHQYPKGGEAYATGPYKSTAEDQQACIGDVFRLCNEFIPDAGRIVACLQGNKKRLSPACRSVFSRSEPGRKRSRHRRPGADH